MSQTSSTADCQVVNVAVYKFAALTQLKRRRRELQRLCRRADLRGTILLADEGINMFIAGDREGVDRLLGELQADDEIGELVVKESFTRYQPFNRMLVKIKREIISFGVDGLDPANRPGRRVSPSDLRAWLDEGRDVALIDTRNDYEVKLGTFDGAHNCHIDHFREFPAAAQKFPAEWRERPVVMFCTGGIRCEKAAPWLESQGFVDVYQLDGGILRYFEEVGREHYHGDCFVFDQRVAVDAALRETDAAQCFACQAILTPEEQRSPEYIPGESCPFCFQTPEDQSRARLRARAAELRELATPLPGSQPYENRRPIYAPARCEGWNVVDFLADVAPGMSREEWANAVESGAVQLAGQRVASTQAVVPGQRYEHVQCELVEPDVNAAVGFVFEDAALVVVDKPAPLPMHPCGRYCKNTLSALLEPLYLPDRLRNAHRLDANTTGLVVYTRSQKMARRLQGEFEKGLVAKTYLARVHGVAQRDQFRVEAAIGAEPNEGGVRLLDPHGLPSTTEFETLARCDDGTTLVIARPLTGRTNQIRLHLWSIGMPIVGDPTYGLGGETFVRQTLDVDEPPMQLHAWKLRFTHPGTQRPAEFEAPLPAWAVELRRSGDACP
ncbi:MAG: sulfurtransferase [Planctomycetales bacterium]|nr:sulfurtransferase [Planctomycetales bacterium]